MSLLLLLSLSDKVVSTLEGHAMRLLRCEKSVVHYCLVLASVFLPRTFSKPEKKKKKGVEDDLVWTNQKGKVRTTKLAVCLASPVPKYPYPHYLLKREENQNQAEKQRHYTNVSVGL